MRLSFFLFISLFILTLFSCKEDETPAPPTEVVVLDETPYDFRRGALPAPNLPEDNALTVAKVQLGRMLFYDVKLSKDGSQACADCHRQENAFTDTDRFSIGVRGLPGKRQAMSVFNMAWNDNEFFWDGRAHLLRDQAVLPIQDELEMDESLENVVAKLRAEQEYTDQFIRAFGDDAVTDDRIGLALEAFMLTIVSHNSKYDKFLAGTAELTESEERGRQLFETEYNPFFPESSGADCQHCHGGANFENDLYMNNGLDTDAEMQDDGRMAATGDSADRGKFKVTTLRNIALTAPYMHDGRFQTLEEVIDHYNEGIQPSATLNPALENTRATGLLLTEQDKVDLLNFLHTLTDEDLLTREEFGSPF